MYKIVLYHHAGSHNHGCEAIVRGTMEILKENKIDAKYVIVSNNPEYDAKYLGTDIDCRFVKPGKTISSKWERLFRNIIIRVLHLPFLLDCTFNNLLKEVSDADVAISIGGDNYSEHSAVMLTYIDNKVREKCTTTILWGCSIDGQWMDARRHRFKIDGLKRFKLITARESLTMNALTTSGITEKTMQFSDPAFAMKAKVCNLAYRFSEKEEIVGINFSPLLHKFQDVKISISSIAETLVQYILETTNKNVLLISHVVEFSDDYELMLPIYLKFSNTGRICIVGKENNAPEIKYHIAKCSMCIVSRTHASIAAYASCVPTVVIGYSLKSRGIAKDLFGTSEKYVFPVNKITNKEVVVECYKWLDENKRAIAEKLQQVIPGCIQNAYAAGKEIKKILEQPLH